MSYVTLPLAALDSDAYAGLTSGDQKFLIDLYVIFSDCERFTVDIYKQTMYRQPAGANLERKLRRLIDAGLLEIVGTSGHGGQMRRVFSFTYPVHELAEAA